MVAAEAQAQKTIMLDYENWDGEFSIEENPIIINHRINYLEKAFLVFGFGLFDATCYLRSYEVSLACFHQSDRLNQPESLWHVHLHKGNCITSVFVCSIWIHLTI